MIGGSEPTVFKQYFETWTEPDGLPAVFRLKSLEAVISEAELWEDDLNQIHTSVEDRKAWLAKR